MFISIIVSSIVKVERISRYIRRRKPSRQIAWQLTFISLPVYLFAKHDGLWQKQPANHREID